MWPLAQILKIVHSDWFCIIPLKSDRSFRF